MYVIFSCFFHQCEAWLITNHPSFGNKGAAWRIIQGWSKWLITMVSFRPQVGLWDPLPNGRTSRLIHGGYILTTYIQNDDPPSNGQIISLQQPNLGVAFLASASCFEIEEHESASWNNLTEPNAYVVMSCWCLGSMDWYSPLYKLVVYVQSRFYIDIYI